MKQTNTNNNNELKLNLPENDVLNLNDNNSGSPFLKKNSTPYRKLKKKVRKYSEQTSKHELAEMYEQIQSLNAAEYDALNNQNKNNDLQNDDGFPNLSKDALSHLRQFSADDIHSYNNNNNNRVQFTHLQHSQSLPNSNHIPSLSMMTKTSQNSIQTIQPFSNQQPNMLNHNQDNNLGSGFVDVGYNEPNDNQLLNTNKNLQSSSVNAPTHSVFDSLKSNVKSLYEHWQENLQSITYLLNIANLVSSSIDLYNKVTQPEMISKIYNATYDMDSYALSEITAHKELIPMFTNVVMGLVALRLSKDSHDNVGKYTSYVLLSSIIYEGGFGAAIEQIIATFVYNAPNIGEYILSKTGYSFSNMDFIKNSHTISMFGVAAWHSYTKSGPLLDAIWGLPEWFADTTGIEFFKTSTIELSGNLDENNLPGENHHTEAREEL